MHPIQWDWRKCNKFSHYSWLSPTTLELNYFYFVVNGRIFSAASGSFPVSPVFHEESTNYYQIRQPSGYVILARFKIPDTNIFKNKCVIKVSYE